MNKNNSEMGSYTGTGLCLFGRRLSSPSSYSTLLLLVGPYRIKLRLKVGWSHYSSNINNLAQCRLDAGL